MLCFDCASEFDVISIAIGLYANFVCRMDASFGIEKKNTSILLIGQNLIDARALVARNKTRDEIICEAMSISLEFKMKKLYKIKNPQINNEGIEKILIQLMKVVMKVVMEVVMEVGFLLKCLIVFFILFGLVIPVKNG